jgi:hypothetical protein
MREKTIVACCVLLVVSGCGNKKEDDTARLSSPPPRIVQGAAEDSNRHQVEDSVDARGKPRPAVPLDEMTRTQLNEYKQLLAQKGFYSCCVEPSCRMCLFEFEECPCEHNLKKKEPVCGECFDKWHNGRGKIKGIKPEDVKKM